MTQYSGVYTLQQQGQALTSGQWCTDPYFKNTTLLLHADGVAGGAQNNTFLDSSTNAFTITRNGNTTQGSFTPYGPTWSNSFVGASYLTTSSTSVFNVGTGNFTVECWIFPTAITANTLIFIGYGVGGTGGIGVGFQTTGLWGIVQSGVAWGLTTSTMPVLNQWNHIVACRGGTGSNQTALFLNGVRVATGTYSTNFSATSSYGVGWDGSNTVYAGYISNLRVNTTDVYGYNNTIITVPTAQLSAITGTVFLTCQSNRFVDNSTSALTVTPAGVAATQRFSPFPPQYQYTPAVIGGSAYFDGTGDYLSVAANAAFTFGTGAFSIESWVYGNSGDVFGNLTFTASNDSVRLRCNTGTPSLETWNVVLANSTIALTANAWNHLVGTFDGTRYRVFVNGVLAGSGTTTYNLSATSTNYIGYSGNGSFTAYYTGYMQGLRVVKGGMPSAYSTSATTNGTAVFTPPTAPLTGSESLTAGSLSLLCNFTNAGIYDNAMMNNLETVGNAQVSTSVVKYGSGSLAFDGSGDYLVSNSATTDLYAFGTGDFTIEMWVNFAVVGSSGVYTLYDSRPNGSQGAYASIALDRSTAKIYYYVSSAIRITGSVTIVANTWYHVVICRSGTSTKLFVNGVQDGSTWTDSTTYLNPASRPVVAASGSSIGTEAFNGYIDDLRITKGVARYTANFQPPKVAFANQ